MLHKVAFIVWGGVFAVHFLAYLPRAARSLATSARERSLAGARARVLLVASALGAGTALALSMLTLIGNWHGFHRH
jgi:hypothetical protein